MTVSTFAAQLGDMSGEYRPGVCNIRPAEIARRRMAGHVGLIATLGLLAFLVVIGAPPITRLIAVLPAAASASGYLQAWLRFCAGFGSRGIFNFGELGATEVVADAEARAVDRRRSRQIGLAALAVGVIVAVVAALLPV
jgi:ferric-dicitrate binding protein FerR (iron transport regulator)